MERFVFINVLITFIIYIKIIFQKNIEINVKLRFKDIFFTFILNIFCLDFMHFVYNKIILIAIFSEFL